MARSSVRKANTSATSVEATDDATNLRCEYPSKYCNNQKATKQKGGVHKFCELHRRKANQNQKRWQQRRRDQRDLLRKQSSARSQAEAMKTATTLLPVETTAEQPPHRMFEPFPIQETVASPPVHLQAPPVQFLSGFAPYTPYDMTCSPEDDLDALTVMLYNDSMMLPEYPTYNWPAMKIDASLELASGYTITGHCAAIV